MDTEEKKKAKSQCETLQKLCSNRKKQNFDELKQWDQMRAHILMIHRKAADDIDQSLQNRIAQSDQFLRVVIQFLTDLQNLQRKYESQPITNPEIKLQTNSVSRNIHFTTTKCLTRLYKATQGFRNHKKLKSLLEEGIKSIQDMLTESERDIMEIRTKIQLKAVEIQNENGLTIQKCEQIAACYSRDKTTKIFQAQHDLFYAQQDFLQQSITQTKTQQSYGELVVELLEFVQKFQKQRLDSIRLVLEKYLKFLLENKEDNENIRSLLDIIEKKTQDQIIHIVYSSQQFVSKQIMKQIKKAEQKNENEKLDLNTIKNFLTKIIYHRFDSRNLVLKQYKTYIKSQQQLENSYLIVTVDAFIHIYQYGDQFQLLEARPDYSLKYNSNIQMTREGQTNLIINVNRWHFINMGKKTIESVNIVFLTEDQREQFLEFVSKIIV